MKFGSNIACFIPIKENSKRVKGKNLRNLGNKPLYRHILDKCTKVFNNVFVDTDSDLIKTYCNNIISAIDTMININSIEDITYITRTKDCKEWSVPDINIKELRNLRQQIDENILMEGLNSLEETA